MAARRYLLLQIRKPEDVMRGQERACFARALECELTDITQHDLITQRLSKSQISEYEAIFVGGSGDFSVVQGGNWLAAALSDLKLVADSGTPMFASCWGFQAISAAFGGTVVNDPSFAELGSINVELTLAGANDRLFSGASESFMAHSGHEDTVIRLPGEARLLASTSRVTNQALKLVDRPVYATQFHPELLLADYLERLHAYPKYVAEITGLPFAEFSAGCVETPIANQMMRRFVEVVVDGAE